jgi:putative transposase
MSQYAAGACPAFPAQTGYFLVVETQKMEPDMRYRDSIFSSLLKPISRRRFKAIVEAHHGDAYDKSFTSWDHLLALIFAQLGATSSLRGLERSWNANAHQHYHLGSGPIARSTLADANHRRPPAVFAETFAMLSGLADRQLRREGADMIRVLDATPIPLGKLHGWAQWNGRTHGLKMHTVFDPTADHPRRIVITPSTVNDVVVGRDEPLEAGAIYIFDKAYCDYGWWARIHETEAVFVTRLKKNAKFEVLLERSLKETPSGDGFTVLADREVRLGQGKTRLVCPLRCISIRRDNGDLLDIVTNDLHRSPVEIATLYKIRWTIELLFRWLKQHLKLASFLGRSENAVRLQILAAMIAYLLLRLAARASRCALPALRFAELVGQCLFIRKPIARIDKPPEVNPSRPRPKIAPGQLEIAYR